MLVENELETAIGVNSSDATGVGMLVENELETAMALSCIEATELGMLVEKELETGTGVSSSGDTRVSLVARKGLDVMNALGVTISPLVIAPSLVNKLVLSVVASLKIAGFCVMVEVLVLVTLVVSVPLVRVKSGKLIKLSVEDSSTKGDVGNIVSVIVDVRLRVKVDVSSPVDVKLVAEMGTTRSSERLAGMETLVATSGCGV
jgi:membrane protein implicated in regulation of membrane protease activity